MAESGGIVGVFRSHGFLANLSRQHLMILASGARPFSVKSGDFLARAGDSANAFYLIQSGRVAVATRRSPHESTTIQTIGPGEVIGWSWIVPGQQWKFDCKAADDVSGIMFDANWLRERCEQDHELGYHLLKQLLTVISSRLAATRGGRDVTPKMGEQGFTGS